MKVRKTVGLTEEELDWIQAQIKKGRFASISHAVRFCLERVMREEKRETS